MAELIHLHSRSEPGGAVLLEVTNLSIIAFIIESVDLRMQNSNDSDVIENCVDLKRELLKIKEKIDG